MAKKALRPIRFDGNIAYVPLTQGYEAIIDAADAALVEIANWQAIIGPTSRTVYAGATFRGQGRARTLMHRHVLFAPPGIEIDHINGNGLDNRRANLRFATGSQNKCNIPARASNECGLKGVTLHPGGRLWRAKIQLRGKQIHLGYFRSKEAAFAAYTEASASLHGEYGRAK